MRTARIKIAAEEGTAVYHCMTRTVNGERVIDDPAKEVLRGQLWLTAEFCGVEILTYAIMSNHFHVLVHVPQKTVPPDAELLRRHRLLHPKPTSTRRNGSRLSKASSPPAEPRARRGAGVSSRSWATSRPS